MKQEVNLFHPMFRKQRRVLSAAALVQSVVLGVLGLLAIYGYGAYQTRELHGEVASLESARDAARARLLDLQARAPRRKASPVLRTEIARLERHLVARRGLAKAIAAQLEGPAGFSSHLEGLARQRVEGLWLTAVLIRDGGRNLRVEGRALSPELVPKLVQRLAVEPSFAGLRFRTLTIDRPDSRPGEVEFVLQTTRVGEAAS